MEVNIYETVYTAIEAIEFDNDLSDSQKISLFHKLIKKYRKMGCLDFGPVMGYQTFAKAFRIAYNETNLDLASETLKEANASLVYRPGADPLLSKVTSTLDSALKEIRHLRETVAIYERKNLD